jgi:hypothetical protein
LPGYLPERRSIDVGGEGDHGKLHAQLRRGEDAASRARAATAALGDGALPTNELEPVAASLDVDALMLIHVVATSETRFRLSGAVYHRGRASKHPVSARFEARVERSGETSTIEGDAEALARTLAESLHPAGPRVASEQPARDSGWARFRHHKAFGYVMGGVVGVIAVGAAVGTGLGIYESHRHELARETVLLGGR